MKKKYYLLSLVILIVVGQNLLAKGFYLNSLGYLPGQPKIASVDSMIESFQVIEVSTGRVIYNGKTSQPVFQVDVKRTVRQADFSQVNKKGNYFLQASDSLKSPVFYIAPDVFNPALVTTMRAFYLWRCGTAVEGDYNGIHYSHKACHMQDGWLDSIGYPNQQKDGTGGWHDAGDHGKYEVNAGITVGMLFMAWDRFNDKLKNLDLNLPETAPGFPDFLKELKWETDWLLKMTYPDGSGRVSHKLTRINFEGFILPDEDLDKRYFTGWSSGATADFVAVMAQAARYFKPYDAVYADKCLKAASLSYQFLKENPAFKPFPWGGFHTGGYFSQDDDDRLWAAAEMWETTGNPDCLADFESRLSKMEVKVDEDWDWGNVRNLGTFTYMLSKRKGKNQTLLDEVKKQVLQVADQIVMKDKNDIFNRPLGGKY